MASANPTKSTRKDASEVPSAVPVAPQPAAVEFKGIEVVEVANKETGQSQVAFQIHPIECFKFLTRWTKEYNVMHTLKEWAASVEWEAQVWTPLKHWSKEQDWKKIKKEVKEGLDEVDWKQVRKDVKDDLEKVDWKEVQRDVKDSLKEVDWKEVRQQVREGMDQVDWKQVKQEAKEVADIVGVQDGVSGLLPESLIDEQGSIKWDQVTKSAKELCPEDLASSELVAGDLNEALQHARDLCPEELECEQAWKSIKQKLWNAKNEKEE